MSPGEPERAFFSARVTAADSPKCRRLVFDPEGVLHQPLTQFVEFAQRRLADESVRSYLSALCRYFTWLQPAGASGRRWNASTVRVRADVMEYLVEAQGCHVREHRLGFRTVHLTRGRRSAVSSFLAALRMFYAAMAAQGDYRRPNPLARHLPTQLTEQDVDESTPCAPRMPSISGCAADPRLARDQPRVRGPRPPARLTESYFVVVNERWTPQPVDDVTFPARIFAAGKQVQWRLREILIARLLFETGARVHELCALTLGDWFARGLRQEATSINKGSRRRRVKFVRWSTATTKLLQRYFDSERRDCDPQHLALNTYLTALKTQRSTLYQVPLFLTAQGRALTARTFRDLYWRPACRAADLDADIHQARHWYVTMAIRAIHEDNRQDPGTERRLEELIRYMAWRGGKTTLQAYEHYFNAIRHAEIQAKLHRRLDRVVRHPPKRLTFPLAAARPQHSTDPEWTFLRRIGGH